MTAGPVEHQGLIDRYAAALEARDGDALRNLLGEDFAEVYPQSGEIMRGTVPSAAALERQPAAPEILGERHVTSVGDDRIALETLVDHGGDPWWMIGLFEVHDDRFRRLTAYYCRPFVVPASRAALAESYDPGDSREWAVAGDGRPVGRKDVEGYLGALVDEDFERVRTIVHPDYRLDYPQSGERFDIERMIAADQAYPGGLPRQKVTGIAGGSERWIVGPTNVPTRISGGGDVWVGEALLEYPSGERSITVGVSLWRAGRPWRERAYFCPPFLAATFRAGLSERLDPTAPLG